MKLIIAPLKHRHKSAQAVFVNNRIEGIAEACRVPKKVQLLAKRMLFKPGADAKVIEDMGHYMQRGKLSWRQQYLSQ